MALSAAELKIADDLLSHNLDLLRLNASMRQDALRALKALEQELTARISTGTLTEYSKSAADYLIASARAVVQQYYADISATAEEALAGLSQVQQAVVRAAFIDVGFGAALAPLTQFATALSDIMIEGAPSKEWWAKQSEELAFKFSNAVRQGIIQGKTNATIIADVRQVIDIGRANAAALVQTSVQTVANVARLEFFRAHADIIDGVQQLSTLDSHTTTICMAYSGAEWDLEGNPIEGTKLPFNGGPPRHWNCRSILVPKTKTFQELGIDASEVPESTRASMDGQVAASTTFEAFLERKGKAFQDEMLGKGRAQLWRDGTITLPQLLDLKGNPLTLAELKAKYVK